MPTPNEATMKRFSEAYAKAKASGEPWGPERPAMAQWWEQDSEFSRILHSANVLFYCPSCQAMAYIGRVTRFQFDPSPWRKDVFAWGNDPINPPVRLGAQSTDTVTK
jgi:hypothetical protein